MSETYGITVDGHEYVIHETDIDAAIGELMVQVPTITSVSYSDVRVIRGKDGS